MNTIDKMVSVNGLLGSLTTGKKPPEAESQVVEDEQEALTTHQAETEQNGKVPLPPEEPEELPDDEEDADFEEGEEEDREEEPVFSDQDKADLPVQEGKFNIMASSRREPSSRSGSVGSGCSTATTTAPASTRPSTITWMSVGGIPVNGCRS